MKLSDAFAQIDVDLAEAQAIVMSLARDLSDGNPALYAKIQKGSTEMQEGNKPEQHKERT